MTLRQEIVYSSSLKADTPITDVGRIARTAHRHNQDHGITGLLLFDGERFCGFLEGEHAVVDMLMHRVAADPRHESVVVHYAGENSGPRLFRHWSMGYVLMQPGSRLDCFQDLRGFAAVERLLEFQEQREITWFERW